MAAVKELLRAENDGSLSFGDYTLSEKTKKDNYEFEGDIYKVKTFRKLQNLRGTECSFMNLFQGAQWKVLKRRIQKLRFLFPQRETFSLLWN